MLSRGFEAPLKEEQLLPIYRWKWDLPGIAHSRGGWAGNVPNCAWFSFPRATTSPHLCCSVSTNSADPQTSFYPRLSPLPLDSRQGSHKRLQQLMPINHAPKFLIFERKVLFATNFPWLSRDLMWKGERPMEKTQSKNLHRFSPTVSAALSDLPAFLWEIFTLNKQALRANYFIPFPAEYPSISQPSSAQHCKHKGEWVSECREQRVLQIWSRWGWGVWYK